LNQSCVALLRGDILTVDENRRGKQLLEPLFRNQNDARGACVLCSASRKQHHHANYNSLRVFHLTSATEHQDKRTSPNESGQQYLIVLN